MTDNQLLKARECTSSRWALCVGLAALSCNSSAPPQRTTRVITAAEHIDALAAAGTTSRLLTGPPPEVILAQREWPLAQRDYAATRATFDSHISSTNIARLRAAWKFALPIADADKSIVNASASALVLSNTLYYVDGQSHVSVLDLATGRVLWQKDQQGRASAPNGLAVGWGKVFVTSGRRDFVALDARSGDELWHAPLALPDNSSIAIAPVVFGGLVYLSSVPIDDAGGYGSGVNGTFYALDQATGEIVWSFASVRDKGLWGHPDINSGGGAWYSPTIDVAGSRMYWGVGNPAPFPGTSMFPLGTSRPGDNLYTDSVVALGPRDGVLHWYYQDRPHDLFDLDFQNPPIVASILRKGVEQHLVIGSGKTGNVVALDAEHHGEVVWRTPVGKHENDQLQSFSDAGARVLPGALGGVLVPPAYACDTIYVPVENLGTQYLPDREVALDQAGSGEVVAIAAADGAVRWRKDLSDLPTSATVVNDLLLVSTLNGLVLAFDRDTGEEVWQYAAPAGINAPLTVTRDMLIIPVGVGAAELIALKLF